MIDTPKDVEAVARALCTLDRGTPDAMTINRDMEDIPYWMVYEPQARAAIKAHTECQGSTIRALSNALTLAIQELEGYYEAEHPKDLREQYPQHHGRKYNNDMSSWDGERALLARVSAKEKT